MTFSGIKFSTINHTKTIKSILVEAKSTDVAVGIRVCLQLIEDVFKLPNSSALDKIYNTACAATLKTFALENAYSEVPTC